MDTAAVDALTALPALDGVPASAAALEQVPLPVSILEAVREDGRIVDFCLCYSNGAAAALAGPEERTAAYGRPLYDVLPAFASTGLLERFIEVVQQGRPHVEEAVRLSGEFVGEHIDLVLDVVATPLGGDFVMAVSRDRTAEHDIGERLVEAQRQLERRRQVEQQVRAVNDGLVGHLVQVLQSLDDGDMVSARSHASEGAAQAAEVVVGLRNLLR